MSERALYATHRTRGTKWSHLVRGFDKPVGFGGKWDVWLWCDTGNRRAALDLTDSPLLPVHPLCAAKSSPPTTRHQPSGLGWPA